MSAHVRVSGELARRVLIDTVPPSARYREGGRSGEHIVFLSHLDRLAAAMRTAGVFLDDREVA